MIPNPIPNVYFDQTAYISFEMVSINPTIYTFKINGLDESESLKFLSNSEGEELIIDLKVKDVKEFQYAPEVIHLDRGFSCITVTRISTNEDRKFKLPWGMHLIPYLEGVKSSNKPTLLEKLSVSQRI